MTMPAGFDQRRDGVRHGPGARPALEGEEHARRAKLAQAVEVMRASSERRHAEITEVIKAIALPLGMDPARLAKVPWLRSQLGELIHMLRQSA